jgi:hypothetical protein
MTVTVLPALVRPLLLRNAFGSPMQVVGEDLELGIALILPIDLRWGGGRPQA